MSSQQDTTPGGHERQIEQQESPTLSQDQEDIPLPEDLDGFVQRWVHTRRNSTGEGLWGDFVADFAPWNERTFQLLSDGNLTNLRDLLQHGGIQLRTRIANRRPPRVYRQLALCVEEESWRQQLALQRAYKADDAPIQTSTPSPAPQFTPAPQPPAPAMQSTPFPKQSSTPEPKPLLQGNQDVRGNTSFIRNGENAAFRPFDQSRNGSQAPFEQPMPQRGARYETPISDPPQHPNLTDYSGRGLATLMKIYDDKLRYSGGNDSLDMCLKIFWDLCPKAGVNPSEYAQAFSTMLKGEAREFYYLQISGKRLPFPDMVKAIRFNFETEERRERKSTWWETITLGKVRKQHPDKTLVECFEQLKMDLLKNQLALEPEQQTENVLRNKVYSACRGIPECSLALFKRVGSFQAACDDLLNSISIRSEENSANGVYTFDVDDATHDSTCDGCKNNIFYADRQFRGERTRYGDCGKTPKDKSVPSKKLCFVCKKEDCWSSKHTPEERKRSYDAFKESKGGKGMSDKRMHQYITDFEGFHEDQDYNAMIDGIELPEEEDPDSRYHMSSSTCFVTESGGDIGSTKAIELLEGLQQQSMLHAMSRLNLSGPLDQDAFLTNRYSSGIFMGIMIDTGASYRSTAGDDQFLALQRIQRVSLDKSRAGEANVTFGIGSTTSLGTADVRTPLGVITFHIVPADVPFLLCLQDMNQLQVKYDNLENVLIQRSIRTPVVVAFGHPWMLLDSVQALVASSQQELKPRSDITCHLTDVELRQLHRRFGHPSAGRLYRILTRAGHHTRHDILARLTKFCAECQLHGKSPGRFKFTLKEDRDFNHSVYMDVLFIDGKPVLQVVDEATVFQAARFLKSMSAIDAWRAFRSCWIDVYLGPPAVVVHDPGTNFHSKEFRGEAMAMNIESKVMPVEAHHSVGIVERYHIPLKRTFKILTRELPQLPKEEILQMSVKAINDTAGPDGLVPTLLVFGAYPRMTWDDAPAASTMARGAAIKAAMAEARRCHAARKITSALRMRNGPRTSHLAALPLNSEVVVWREKKGWQGPFHLLAVEGETCKVQLPNGPTDFRSTVVKPFHRDPEEEIDTVDKENLPDDSIPQADPEEEAETETPITRNPRIAVEIPAYVPDQDPDDDTFTACFLNSTTIEEIMVFITEKEERDRKLSLELREKGIITTPGAPFQQSRRKEVESLLAQGTFKLIDENDPEIGSTRIFGSRLVDEVKGKETATPYEKSRLVVQGFNDQGKKTVLTQSPTLQRLSQRIILALAPALYKMNINLILRDITQAYPQSTSHLARPIYARPPREIIGELPPGTIFKVMRPLYGIAEAGMHWFNTYHTHHRVKLGMKTSTFDLCLLMTHDKNGPFGLVGLQTDDTLILGDEAFIERENDELHKAKLIAKPAEKLTSTTPLLFNGCKLTINENGSRISLQQKGQGKRLELIDPHSKTCEHAYIEQRARGAYLGTICQPEAVFDLSTAAQYQHPDTAQIRALNKRLKWQIDNQSRGLDYIPLDLAQAKLYVFVDGSFANNADLSSQIGYVIVLANEVSIDNGFKIVGNLIHWSSTKCKRVTRAVLASELYAMVAGIDAAISISTTLRLIMQQLKLPPVPTVVCTDSFSLYECMVKLGTTREKRLMIDIMAIRQSYERRELSEIRWITGPTNPADAMTKSDCNGSLRALVSTNQLQVGMKGWVQRPDVVWSS